MPRHAAILPLAACTLALAACTSPENESLRFGRSDVLPAFQTKPHQLPPAGPSVTGLDRSDWAPVEYMVPVMGTAHQPTYAPDHYRLASLARQRGEYPTAESALELGHPDAGEEAWQAAKLHGWAFLDAVLVLPRAVLRPPCATDWSPSLDYARAHDAPGCGSACGDCATCCEEQTGECCAEPAQPAPASE